MKKFTPATKDTVTDVLRAWTILVQNEHDADARQAWADSVNDCLDALLAEDAFGTEGQLDPRGDHRE